MNRYSDVNNLQRPSMAKCRTKTLRSPIIPKDIINHLDSYVYTGTLTKNSQGKRGTYYSTQQCINILLKAVKHIRSRFIPYIINYIGASSGTLRQRLRNLNWYKT